MTLLDAFWLLCLSIIGYYMVWMYSCFQRKSLSAQNKTVLITGCGSGFGYQLTIRLSQLGYHVIAGCRSVEGKGVETLRSCPGVDVIQLDVTKDEDISKAVKTVSEKLGKNTLWAVVNNAGKSQVGEIEWFPMQTLLKLVDVNTFGMIRITKAFLPFLKTSKGRIVNITSVTGNKRVPGSVGYAMSKAAARSFTNGIRLEMKKWDIQVIEIAPYFYSTPMVGTERMNDMLKENWDNSDKETRLSLGTQYFEEYVKFINGFLNVLRIPSSEGAINCMVEAVVSYSPKLFYEPKNIINAIIIDTPHYFPPFIQDLIQYWYLPKLCTK